MNSQLNKLDYTKHSNSNWIEKRKNDIGLTDSFLMDSSNNEIGEIMSSFDTHGFAVIKGDKGYGLIDKQLKVVLDCSYIFKYNRCGPDFAYHYLVVQKNGCYGLVNEIGKIVVPCQYPGFASFSNADNNNLLDRGFLCITDGNKYGLIEIANSNQYLLNCVYDRIVFHSNKQYIWQDFLYAADNRYIVGYSAKSCTVFDVLSRQFFTINEQVYNIEVIVNYHVVAISKFSKTDDTLKYNILSIENGITMNEKEYDGLATLDGEYIQVRQGENWGIFDLSENKEIIPCQYFHGEKQSCYSVHFCPGFMIKPNEELILVLNDGLWGYINKSNNLVIDCIYEKARPFSDGMAAVYQHFYWRFINSDGEFVGGKYIEVLDFKEGMAGVKEFDKWGYINKYGIQIIPSRFSEAKSFAEGLAPVAFKNKWGYINEMNETVIPFRYQWAYSFNDGLASVNDYGGNGHIDKNGKWIDYEEYKQDNNTYHNYDAERWDALTDGMEGDYPGSGVDYDLLGF